MPSLSPQGFPGSSDGKESACNAGDPGSIPGLGLSPGEGNGNPIEYSCLGNAMDRLWDCKESVMTERLTVSVLHLLLKSAILPPYTSSRLEMDLSRTCIT